MISISLSLSLSMKPPWPIGLHDNGFLSSSNLTFRVVGFWTTWPTAMLDEFDPVPRICRIILAVYESDLRNPQWEPSGRYRLNSNWVIKRVTYEQTQGHAPPYLIYCDQEHRQSCWQFEASTWPKRVITRLSWIIS